jgi:hypothetical protein
MAAMPIGNPCLMFPDTVGLSRKCFAYRDLANSMQTIETTNPMETRRARYAQYRGQKATLMLMGTTVTGLVRSVNENGSGTLKRWIVTVVKK